MAAVTALLKAKHKPEKKAAKGSSSLTQGQMLQASYTAHVYSANAQQQAAGMLERAAQTNTMASNGSKVLPSQLCAKGAKEEGEGGNAHQKLTEDSFSMLEDGGCAQMIPV